MKSSFVQTLFIIMGSSAASRLDAQHADSDNAMTKLRCGAVNFLMTTFLPTAQTTAFCSAYLQFAEHTSTTTATMAGSTRTITETSNLILPTTTRTLSTTHTSTSTTTVDLWIGRPACTAVPNFEWVRDWRSQRSQRTSDLVKAACSCLEIPESTKTALAIATTTPTLTITEGMTGLAEATSVETQTVVQTHTKFTFLSKEMNYDLVNRTVVFEDKSLVLPKIERTVATQSSRSSRSGAGSMMARFVRHVGSWKHAGS